MTISPVYTAIGTATGGRNGRGTVEASGLDLTLAAPKEMGGNGQGSNPEQLFAVGYSACYIGAMQFATTQDDTLAKVPADVSVTTHVGIGPNGQGGFGLTVKMSVHMPGVDKAEAERVAEAGHKICPYSNAIQGNVDVTTEVV
ncbi:organic hydroperoxide resistance protein [Phaeobacter gallaeciensis]|uniref:Organic hydroperoxide resistance protein n=2 Tax=Roseobacteraceae TaxID=2854170 RepID=A0A366X0L0_9RHOB|nr:MULTISPECIES: organic hydroperoxide resistance protein [Roseobacteraceae]MBT3142094.1 organic hydroperoxide resistance protein [Falsiruegeria litorea]MBT8168560.1 organic hydroperoxide resistance protein [Falsiruegeria litorea]RBW53962.1 organic hydroperoxide resistance protein [Phaeobacter gallaeciensis]